MPSLREMMLLKQQEEAAAQAKLDAARVVKPVAPVEIETAPAQVEAPEQEPMPVEQVQESTKGISMDTLRGLYWLATADHVGDKKATRGQLKRKLNDLLLTKDGMRVLLRSLEQFVFS